jgi:asparagine synthase (glutamine-hydrolysing)
MCGINGYIFKSKPAKENIISYMNASIHHRGPDDEGIHKDKVLNKYIGLGMTRLSIIDLSTGKQPIYSEDKSLVIVFNGEIYNYQSLKIELETNHKTEFNTNSDTEVILKMYETYGVESFSKLDGMFAFSILDKNIGKVFIARDFFGEKPLYYSKQMDRIIWGSELKSLMLNFESKPKINKEALSLYFQLTYIPAPYSIYDGVKKLLPNHYLEVDIDTLDIIENEISKLVPQKISNISFKKAKKVTHDLVMESVSSRSISDVPIGTFLSGGVDSSIVSLCLSKTKDIPIDTFSLGFDKKSFDETEKSRLVAKAINSKHHEFIVNSKSLEEDLENVILNYDEPFADSSALPTYLVSKLTSNHVKVALTGDGGDEVFGGYNKYYMGKINSIYTKTLPKSIHNNLLKYIKLLTISKEDKRGKRYKLRKLLESINYNNDFYKNIISLAFKSEELKELLFEDVNVLDSYFENKTMSSINDFRNLDKNISLEGDMLVKVDRASMFASIECRAPFLNKKIWNFTNSLPDDYLIKGWNKKYILKQAFQEYFPEQFLEKSKMGFAVPVGDWLRTNLKKELRDYIDIDFLNEQSLFRIDYIVPLVQNHIEAKVDNTFRVWSFYCFQKWYTKVYNI